MESMLSQFLAKVADRPDTKIVVPPKLLSLRTPCTTSFLAKVKTRLQKAKSDSEPTLLPSSTEIIIQLLSLYPHLADPSQYPLVPEALYSHLYDVSVHYNTREQANSNTVVEISGIEWSNVDIPRRNAEQTAVPALAERLRLRAVDSVTEDNIGKALSAPCGEHVFAPLTEFIATMGYVEADVAIPHRTCGTALHTEQQLSAGNRLYIASGPELCGMRVSGRSLREVEGLLPELPPPHTSFVNTQFVIPEFLRSADNRRPFSGNVRYELENVVAPDGTVLALYVSANSNGVTAGTLAFTNNALFVRDQATALSSFKLQTYVCAYVICGLLGRPAMEEYLSKLVSGVAHEELNAFVVALKSSLVYPATRIPKAAVELHTRNFERQIYAKERSVNELENERTALLEQLVAIEKRIGEAVREIQLIKLTQLDMAQKMQKAIDQLSKAANNAYLKSLHVVSDNTLIIVTNNIEVTVPGGLVFDVGRLLIEVPLGRGSSEIRVWNIDRRPSGRSVPHAFQNQGVCWGNITNKLADSMREYDIVSVVNLILMAVTTVNVKDGLGSRIVDWPLSPKSKKKSLNGDEKTKILTQRFDTEELAQVLEIQEDEPRQQQAGQRVRRRAVD